MQVTVALSTLLGLDQQPGELDGHGPIPPHWPAPSPPTPPAPGDAWSPIHTANYSTTADTPTGHTNLDQHIRARDATCTFPGCRRPAKRCETDHIVAWQDGGTTSENNLHPLCTRHHHLKHDTRWTVRRRPDGSTRWQAPTGHTYQRPPPDRLPIDCTSVDRDEPPPF